MTDIVLSEVRNGVALVTLNRPDRMNAWTPAMQSEYFDALGSATADPDVRAVVVTGAGRGFCPGADMAYLEELGSGTPGQRPTPDPRPMIYPLSVPKPMIAAINGACAGLGLVHALMCDVRIAAAGAKFTTAFSRRGLVAEHGASWLLPRLVGTSRALDLLLSARVFTSEEALELGVVNRVVAPNDVVPVAMEYATDLATNCSPTSMAVIKSQIYRHASMDLDGSWNDANRSMAASLRAADFAEGVASFVKKRPPRFAPLADPTP